MIFVIYIVSPPRSSKSVVSAKCQCHLSFLGFPHDNFTPFQPMLSLRHASIHSCLQPKMEFQLKQVSSGYCAPSLSVPRSPVEWMDSVPVLHSHRSGSVVVCAAESYLPNPPGHQHTRNWSSGRQEKSWNVSNAMLHCTISQQYKLNRQYNVL